MKQKMMLFGLLFLMVFMMPISVNAAVTSLHFDCSDITVFDGRATTSWVPTGFNVSFGNISSDGDCYHVGSYGLGESLPHGPMYYNTIEEPFPLDDFRNMTLDIEFNSTDATEMGYLLVILHDVVGTPVIGITILDCWAEQVCMQCWGWQNYLDGRHISNSETPIDYGRKEIILYRNNNSLFVDVVDSYYNNHIGVLEAEELEREINYISMMFCEHPPHDSVPTMKIFDMELLYGDEDVTTTTTTTTTETTTTTTTTETTPTIVTTIPENDNLPELVVAGTIGGFVALGGAFVFKKITGNKKGDK